MTTWLYKATEAKVPRAVTQDLVGIDRFICRSPHDLATGRPAKRVDEVKIGDFIHVYCIWKGSDPRLGKYQVVEKTGHKHEASFGERWQETALYLVEDDEFITRRDTQGGYQTDPAVGAMTGWLLAPVEPAMRAMPYEAGRFKVYETLVEFPED